MHQYTSLHTHNIYILLYRTININYYILGKHCAHKQTVYLVKSKILARKMMFCTHAGSLRNHQTNYTYLRQGSLHFWNPRYLQREQLSLVNQVKEGCIFRHFRHLPWQIKQSWPPAMIIIPSSDCWKVPPKNHLTSCLRSSICCWIVVGPICLLTASL